MNIWQFMGDHPILTFLLVLMMLETVHQCVKSIADAARRRSK